AGPNSIVVLGEPEWRNLVGDHDVVVGGAREAASAFLGREAGPEPRVELPGRLDWRSPDEVWDGAHTPEAVEWLLARLPRREWVVVASVLRDKDVEGILERLAQVGKTLVA